MPERRAQGEQTSLQLRKLRAGQRIVVGLQGPGLSPEERRLFRELRPGGFILFARNIEEPAQVRELNRELASLLPDSLPPLLTVDQEGGRVLRIKETRWPPARFLGNVDRPALTRQVAEALGQELRAMGFNLDFAPVADVDSNPANPIIGDRSFGRTPARVIRHMHAFMDGLHAAGIIACCKHFPGHGDTAVDSHKDLPIVEKDRRELLEVELAPFRAAVEAGIGIVMSSHVVFPAFDEDWPATLSTVLMKQLLRRELGFGGVVISDDMEMRAVRGRWPLAELLERATRASVDLFCIGRSFEHGLDHVVEAWEHLIRFQEDHPRLDKRAQTSLKRLDALREARLQPDAPLPPLAVVGATVHQQLASLVRAEGGEGVLV
jgi:beta-N-acetylhexosaminidase